MRTGRPPKAEEDRRTDNMKIPLSEAEKLAIQAGALADGAKPVTWARKKLLDAAKSAQKKRKAGESNPVGLGPNSSGGL